MGSLTQLFAFVFADTESVRDIKPLITHITIDENSKLTRKENRKPKNRKLARVR
jgi:hypothetical protein